MPAQGAGIILELLAQAAHPSAPLSSLSPGCPSISTSTGAAAPEEAPSPAGLCRRPHSLTPPNPSRFLSVAAAPYLPPGRLCPAPPPPAPAGWGRSAATCSGAVGLGARCAVGPEAAGGAAAPPPVCVSVWPCVCLCVCPLPPQPPPGAVPAAGRDVNKQGWEASNAPRLWRRWAGGGGGRGEERVWLGG